MSGYVYFLRPIGMDGPVKIGCSMAPELRLQSYMPWSPYPLEVAATLPGDHRLEARFHNQFRAQHTHHEWFTASPELTATIEAIRADTFDVDSLPGGPRIGWFGPRKRWTAEQRLHASMSRRMDKLRIRGINPPSDVAWALARYNAGRYAPAYDKDRLFDPADAKLVCDFLAKHGETPPLAQAA